MAEPNNKRFAGLAGVLAAGALLIFPGWAAATTITVNSTADTAANDNACTLREAITAANANAASGAMANECAAGQASPTEDQINFSIAGAGPHTISPGSALPELTSLATIDGSTDTNPGPAVDEIRLDGTAAGGVTGIKLGSGSANSTVRALSIYNFSTGIVAIGGSATIEDCFIGTDKAGTLGIGNDSDGIDLNDSNNVVDGCVISGNGFAGILSTGGGNTISSNLIGTTPPPTTANPNVGGGLFITQQSDGTTIGGPNAFDGNIISGNGGIGLYVSEVVSVADPASDVVIQNNRIGTALNGESAVPNTSEGIRIQGNVADAVVADNLISGNGATGLAINASITQPVGAPGPANTTVTGNLIGTDKDGTTALANGDEGIGVSGGIGHATAGTLLGGTTGLTPGGACSGDCNLVSSNASNGIGLSGESTGTQVLGNYVGTDLAGTADRGNGGQGVLMSQSDGTVGSPEAPNVVSGNAFDGVSITDSEGVTVQSNLVGVGADGSTAVGNTVAGITVNAATDVLVGGTGASDGNRVVGNAQGVRVLNDAEAAVMGNSIDQNTPDLGLNLDFDGVTPNDADDVDTGPNDLQNFPVLDNVVAEGTQTIALGSLNSAATSDFRIEFFSNPAGGDPSGFGEGDVFLGSIDVSTNSGGDASFVATDLAPTAVGDPVTATATRLDGTGAPLVTSEFADNVNATPCDVQGTSGDDELTGEGVGDNVICARGGDDVITPDGGDDIVLGGTGTDEVKFSDATSAVDADLVAGSADVGADSIVLDSIEDVTGGDKADDITGDDAANTLKGGKGKDTVEAAGGGDTLDGGDGDDTLKGQDGGDTLKGKDDDDDLRGGDGGDDLKGGDGKKDDLDGGDGKDSLDGGGGSKDVCDGGPDHDEKHAPGCETKKSLP